MSEINLTIDGLAVKSQPGLSLLLAARAQGIDIPTLCYHDDLKPDGRCRLCVVEIGEPGRSRLVNSCTYPVEEGLIVQTKSEMVLASRRLVLELLMAQAPAAELIKQMAAELGVYETRFKPGHPQQRCILCGLCVRTCREVVGVSAISLANRTPGKLVATPFNEPSEACIGCGSCVFICPTNVIAYEEKDGIRTVWGRHFELQACKVCGNYIAPKAQLEHWAKITGDPVESFFVCRDCR
ncbi:MAG TPA: 2Fe-2S iron-sulfur cluster-binding protein [Desulfobaccales bacterium]